MTSISRLNSNAASRIAPEYTPPAAQPAVPSITETSQKPQSLGNLFRADSFGANGSGDGSQDMLRKLEELSQTVSKLAHLLGGQGARPTESSGTEAASGVGGAGGASPHPSAMAQEPVPELGDVAPADAPKPAGAPTAASGASDAKDFLAKGPHPQDQVYKEIAHAEAGLGEKKQALWDAAHQAGASDAEAAVLVAQQMQEGANDPNKSGAAENFGPLNLNRDLLKDFGGVKEENLSTLNEHANGKYTPEALRANVEGALTAMRTMGTERYLDHVRAGSSGYENPTQRMPFAGAGTADDDTRRFGRNIANAANLVLSDFQKDPGSIGRDWRQAAEIAYV
ncbi:hypothetical protein [Melittangium boletus]|uniref:hypothetical protein n=1 Tax=Melittangium boletus TaxID=83453 RepID=UPI003DA4F273